jgi:hypothetical protein
MSPCHRSAPVVMIHFVKNSQISRKPYVFPGQRDVAVELGDYYVKESSVIGVVKKSTVISVSNGGRKEKPEWTEWVASVRSPATATASTTATASATASASKTPSILASSSKSAITVESIIAKHTALGVKAANYMFPLYPAPKWINAKAGCTSSAQADPVCGAGIIGHVPPLKRSAVA